MLLYEVYWFQYELYWCQSDLIESCNSTDTVCIVTNTPRKETLTKS